MAGLGRQRWSGRPRTAVSTAARADTQHRVLSLPRSGGQRRGRPAILENSRARTAIIFLTFRSGVSTSFGNFRLRSFAGCALAHAPVAFLFAIPPAVAGARSHPHLTPPRPTVRINPTQQPSNRRCLMAIRDTSACTLAPNERPLSTAPEHLPMLNDSLSFKEFNFEPKIETKRLCM